MKTSALFPPVLSRSPHCVDAMFMDGQSVFPCGASLYLSGLHAHPASVMAVRPPAQASAMLLANPRIEEPIFEGEPREVGRLGIGCYAMDYEFPGSPRRVPGLLHRPL